MNVVCVMSIYNYHLERITTGWRTTQNYDPVKEPRKVMSELLLGEMVENYVGEVK